MQRPDSPIVCSVCGKNVLPNGTFDECEGYPCHTECRDGVPFYTECRDGVPFYTECRDGVPFYTECREGVPFPHQTTKEEEKV